MKWFQNPQTLEELKKQYKKLAMKYHPDLGGDTATMQEINNEYDSLFEQLKNTHTNAKGETYTTTVETKEAPEEFRNIINVLIALKGINIEVCGSWLWITGNTREYKEIFKSLKFRWSKSKQAWYYHTSDYRKKSKKTYSLNEIRDLYGSQTIQAEPEMQVAIV